MVVYIENPKEGIKKSFGTNEWSYKVYTPKSVISLYASSEIKNTLLFLSALPQMIYLGISLTKFVQDSWKGSYKTMMKEEQNKWILHVYG